MAITSPVTVPSQLKFARAEFDAFTVVGRNVSPFTLAAQHYVHAGELLEIAIACPPMERADAEEVVAWLVSLNGTEHSFLLPPPGYHMGARGSLLGTPVVNGASQTGKTLASTGWNSGAQGVLLAGDWLQLGTAADSHLHKVVSRVNATGNNASIEIWPRLRASPANLDAIVVTSPKGAFRLADSKRSWSIEQAMIYGVSFRVREDI